MAPFKIAILGAGPSGLTLASLLSSSSSPTPSKWTITIYESDPSPHSRCQGGTLDLHTSGGLLALRTANLYSQFLVHARFDGEAIAIADKELLKYVSRGPSTAASSHGRPEIDRARLREVLLGGVPAEWVRWGHRVVRVEEEDGRGSGTRSGREKLGGASRDVEAKAEGRDGSEGRAGSRTYALCFLDGTVERGFDLVVGADGAWSKVRPLLTNVRPHYSGLKGFGMLVPDVETRYPDLHRLVNRGSLFTFGDGKALNVQQLGDGSMSVGESGVRSEDWGEGWDSEWEGVRRRLLEEYKGWAPELRKCIEVADGEGAVCRPYYMLPIGHRWEHRSGLTLVGDAAHLMTPYAGIGVNLAMEDSMKLAQAIAEAADRDDLDKRIQTFEEEMFERAGRAQRKTWGNVEDMFFTPGAPRTTIESYILRMMLKEDSPSVLRLLANIVVRTFYGIFKMIY
ncbi:MAG: hypothetical protein MMC23_005344 [Stictis urceolatum]|nr:hypothetical protein [Stictis urceolata]